MPRLIVFFYILLHPLSSYATAFKPFMARIETTIDANELLPPRLIVTGFNGGKIEKGVLTAKSDLGIVSTANPVILESWDSDNDIKVRSTWKLISYNVSVIDIHGDLRVLDSRDFDVFFNKTEVDDNSDSICDTSIKVSLESNKAQTLRIREKIIAKILVSVEALF